MTATYPSLEASFYYIIDNSQTADVTRFSYFQKYGLFWISHVEVRNLNIKYSLRCDDDGSTVRN